MIKTLAEIIKELSMVAILIGLADITLKLFLRRTLLGKMVAVLIKDIFLSFKVSFRITRYLARLTYKFSKKLYKFLQVQYKNYNEKQQEKEVQVVNGEVLSNENNNDNVIDLFQYVLKKVKEN